jgi:taurine--2-oxoglutarate transaminase
MRWLPWDASSASKGCTRFVRWNTFFTNPPLCINEQQMREAFAIIDRGLEITDKAVS